MSEIEKLFAGIDRDSKVFELGDTTEEAPADSQAASDEEGKPALQGGEEGGDAKAPEVEEKNIPFHQHPRWIALKKRDEENKKVISELSSKLSSFEEKFSKMTEKEQQTAVQNLPPEFVQLFGDNPDAWEAMSKLMDDRADKIAESKLSAYVEQERERNTAQQRADAYIEQEFANLSEETGLDFSSGSTLRNGVMKIATEYQPLNETGDSVSLAKSYDLWRKLNATSDTTGEKKRIAANASGTRSSAVSEDSDAPMTSSRLRKSSIKSFFN